jgi:tol-pal system protein YbgF
VRSAAALFVAALAAGCSASPPWVSPDEHQRLARQLLELERRAAQSELEIERLKHRLGELAGPSSPVSPPAPAAPAPAFPAGVPLASEPSAIVPRPSAAEIEESELGDELAAPPEEASDYERGLVDLRDGRPGEAEIALARFAAENPDSDLADNAWFWIGESRLARGETATAIDAYRECLERYPDGNKVPDAMLKLGHAFALSGDRAAARETWSELVRRFPATAAAEAAQGRLSTL